MNAIAPSAALLSTVLSVGAAAQSDSGLAAFLSRARSASARYRDPSAALADGYHAIGPEAPAMGQHWIQPGLVITGRLEPDRPPILEYATIGGRQVLVGVAYALVLAPGEAPPEYPAGRAAWHSHGRDLEEESLRLTHEDGPAAAARERVVVLHAWVWATNPAGPFAPLNWALPYRRSGFAPPPAPGPDAKALSLSGEGAAFWEAAIGRALEADAATRSGLHQVLAAYADTVARWEARHATAPRASLGDRDRAWLIEIWGRLGAALESVVPVPNREALVMLTSH